MILCTGAALTLAACGGGDGTPELMNLRANSRGADEFGILPVKPLELPQDVSALPAPTPGGTNRTDPTPQADAVAALGGSREALQTDGRSADTTLLAHAGRYGADPAIRGQLAAEDLEWRRDHDGRLLERLFDVTIYYRAYAPMSLDQHAELDRWRARGVQNVGAPPEGLERE